MQRNFSPGFTFSIIRCSEASSYRGKKAESVLEKSVNGGLRVCNYETFLSVFELLFLLCRFHPVSTWDVLKMEVCPPRKRIRTGNLPL